ncbi:hypothetical protein [Caldimonas sp. KR1-144]|uniref:hypothetical protein n=1 Tax=Caldimonas sp. KR1-144 TaxID=3400911 RepID=UPI003C03EBC0
MKPNWIWGVVADLAVVAAWALAGWAAHQSIAESDARRAMVAPPSLQAQQPAERSPG